MMRTHWAELQARALVKAQGFRDVLRWKHRHPTLENWGLAEFKFWLDCALAMAHMKRAVSLPEWLRGETVRTAFLLRLRD